MIMSVIETAIRFLAAHPYVAYFSTFLLALSESLPVVGLIVPGTTLIIMLAALVPGGVLRAWPLVIAAILGAIAGDGIAFRLGQRYRHEVLGMWPINRFPQFIRRCEEFFERHGKMSVFTGRFAPAVRAFVPLMAGVLGMPLGRFELANVASALLWAPSHILAGVFTGAALSSFGTAAKPLAALLVVILAVGWTALHLVRYALRHATTLAQHLRDDPAMRATRFGRLFIEVSERHEARALALAAALLIGTAWLFFGVLEDVIERDPLVLADHSIYYFFQSLRTLPGDRFMIAVTELGDSVVVVAVTAAVFLWLAAKRSWRTASYWVAAIAGASALNTAIKVGLHRTRPNELLYSGWSAFSFPSGHSTVNLALYGFFAFLVTRELPPSRRLPVAFGCAALIFMIAVSRLYLGAHWFSDVVGGLAFGSMWLALLGLFYLRRPIERLQSHGLLIVGCMALVFCGAFHISTHHAEDVKRYAVRTVTPTMPLMDWQASGWENLPVRRIDISGDEEEPLAFQWAGNLDHLANILHLKGWRTAAPWTSANIAAWLTNSAPPVNLPVVPLLAAGRLPGLVLVHAAASYDARLVLRLWTADITLTGGPPLPLWVGSVVVERVWHLFLITLTIMQRDFDTPLRILSNALEQNRLVVWKRGSTQPGWSGLVLLDNSTCK